MQCEKSSDLTTLKIVQSERAISWFSECLWFPGFLCVYCYPWFRNVLNTQPLAPISVHLTSDWLMLPSACRSQQATGLMSVFLLLLFDMWDRLWLRRQGHWLRFWLNCSTTAWSF